MSASKDAVGSSGVMACLAWNVHLQGMGAHPHSTRVRPPGQVRMRRYRAEQARNAQGMAGMLSSLQAQAASLSLQNKVLRAREEQLVQLVQVTGIRLTMHRACGPTADPAASVGDIPVSQAVADNTIPGEEMWA